MTPEDAAVMREGRRRLPDIERGISRLIGELAEITQRCEAEGRDRRQSEERRFAKINELLDLHLAARNAVINDLLAEMEDELDQSERAAMRAEADFQKAISDAH